MKGAVEAILKDIRATDIHFEGPTGAPSDASYHPGRCATVWSGSNCIGIFGQIHPWRPRTTAWTPSSTAPSSPLTSS